MRLYLLVIITIIHLNHLSSMPTHASLPNHPSKETKQELATSKRQQRGPYSLPVTHQYLTNLHVIPLQNVYQNQMSQNRTVTQLVPIYSYIPLRHNYLVPVQELQVIPLSRHHQLQPVANHYRRENRREDIEVNRYRTFYGGHGNGLYFGGHGAGHGFYTLYG